MPPDLTPLRRFPPLWTVEEANDARFIVRDRTGQALGYFYFENEPGRRTAANLLEARAHGGELRQAAGTAAASRSKYVVAVFTA